MGTPHSDDFMFLTIPILKNGDLEGTYNPILRHTNMEVSMVVGVPLVLIQLLDWDFPLKINQPSIFRNPQFRKPPYIPSC
jgi:hypothetical protein